MAIPAPSLTFDRLRAYRASRLAGRALALVPLALALAWTAWRVLSLASPERVIDDGFMLFRYAENLASGQGAVFNPGERVEGYVTFLWVGLLALGHGLGLDTLVVARLLAGAAYLGTVAVLLRLGTALLEDHPLWVQFLPAALYAAMACHWRYVLGGMETSLFAFLVTLACHQWVTRASAFRLGSVFALAVLTRPEAVLYVGLGAALLLVGGDPAQPRRERVRHCFATLGWFAALYLPYFLARWAYYGYLLPNPFYAKVGGGSAELWARGWRLLGEAGRLGSLELPAVLALLACALAARQRRSVWFLALAAVVTACYFVAVGGDFLWFFGPRFLLPVVPGLLVLAVLGAAELARRLGRRSVVLGHGLFAVAAVALCVNAVWFTWPAQLNPLDRLASIHRGWIETGKWVRQHSAPTDRLAVAAAGAIPYYAERRTIDMLGLNDAAIAHRPMPVGKGHPGHEKYDSGYVLDQRPEILVHARLDARGRPLLLEDWERYRVRFEQEYALEAVAIGELSTERRPWVLPATVLTPELFRQGYVVGVYRRRPTGEATTKAP
jgi:arabinofuranosyltransferase